MNVSVIVPVFNDAEGIRRTLNALLEQTFREFEVIVADNGSGDGTAEVVRRFAETHPALSIRVILVEKPGSYAARNAAVRVASGNLLAFTDSECLPVPGWLAAGIGALEEGHRYVAGPIFFEFKRSQPLVAELVDSEKHLNQEYHAFHGWSATANMFTTREAYEQVGGFSEDVYSGADRLFGAQMQRAGIPALLAPEAVVWHPARNTWSAVRKKRKRVAAGMAQRHSDGTQSLLAGLGKPSGTPPSRLQRIPRPAATQLPGYYLLKLLCKLDQDRVTKETLLQGKAGVKFRS